MTKLYSRKKKDENTSKQVTFHGVKYSPSIINYSGDLKVILGTIKANLAAEKEKDEVK